MSDHVQVKKHTLTPDQVNHLFWMMPRPDEDAKQFYQLLDEGVFNNYLTTPRPVTVEAEEPYQVLF